VLPVARCKIRVEPMICPRCGLQTPNTMAFCGHCGAVLPQLCWACGTPNPAEFRFCGRCGAALGTGRDLPAGHERPAGIGDRAALSASDPPLRRQVTVMFCDIADSVAISASLDEEDYGQIIRAYREICVRETMRAGGTITRYVGDGLLVAFGFPAAHEDDPRRAVTAGLAIAGAIRHIDGAKLPILRDPLTVRARHPHRTCYRRRFRGRGSGRNAGPARRDRQHRGQDSTECRAELGDHQCCHTPSGGPVL
jgi:hypothetical protein